MAVAFRAFIPVASGVPIPSSSFGRASLALSPKKPYKPWIVEIFLEDLLLVVKGSAALLFARAMPEEINDSLGG